MPINAYTGLMGSGKSFECVVSVILPALCVGRRVVTNVDGIDNDACRAYCHEKFDVPMERLGSIVHCSNEDVQRADFLTHGTDVETICKAGDMVCIDEAWRFWGTGTKILKEHAIFFREHRHYVNEATKVSCDLVLMVQDIGDLHRTLKVVVELNFRTTKMKSLGLNKLYRVEMWEGYKQTAKARVSVQNKKYNPEIFPLYSSYVGGHGKELQVDNRQNIFNNKMLWLYVAAALGCGSVGIYGAYGFFYRTPDVKDDQKMSASTPDKTILSKSSNPPVRSVTAMSEVWRVAGRFQSGDVSYVLLTNPSGRVRVEHPSSFQNSGVATVGEIDGERVTVWSGSLAASDNPQEAVK